MRGSIGQGDQRVDLVCRNGQVRILPGSADKRFVGVVCEPCPVAAIMPRDPLTGRANPKQDWKFLPEQSRSNLAAACFKTIEGEDVVRDDVQLYVGTNAQGYMVAVVVPILPESARKIQALAWSCGPKLETEEQRLHYHLLVDERLILGVEVRDVEEGLEAPGLDSRKRKVAHEQELAFGFTIGLSAAIQGTFA